MIRLFIGMWACLSCLGCAASASAEIHIWTAPSTLKILKSDEPQNASGPAVKLAAARREVAAFQIAVRSDRDVHGFKLSGNVTGAKLTIWREHYLQTTKEGERPDPLTPAA